MTGTLINMLTYLTGQKLICPFYHTISNSQLPHIKHLYPVRSVEKFIKDIDTYLKFYEPLNLDQLVDIANNEKVLKKKSFFLSFDDGLREVYDNIYPVLKEKGIPATVFINSAFVDNKDLFFRYKASLLVENLNENNIKKIRNTFPSLKSFKTIMNYIFSIRYFQKEKIDELAKVVGINFSEFLSTQKPYLTTNQILELKDNDFTFGGHSIDHPEFQDLAISEMIKQVTGSAEYLQNNFDIRSQIFSFPFTDYMLKKEAFQAIYNTGVELTFGTAGIKKDEVKRNIQRIPVEKYKSSGKLIVIKQLVLYLLKLFIGKHIIYRN